MKTEPLWYIRRGQEVSGPFPVGLIERHILLSRINSATELSPDKVHWALMPEWPEWQAYLDDLNSSEGSEETLALRRRWEDERDGYDRRSKESATEANDKRRSGKDRRHEEPDNEISSRQQRHQRGKRIRYYSLRAAAIPIFAVVVFVSAYLILYKPATTHARVDCSLEAAEGINWSHCDLQNSTLAQVSLSHSNLQSSNLTGADLDQANLSSAELSFSVFTLARIQDSNFENSRIIGVSFRNSLIKNTKFDNSDLTYADFSNADISDVSFDGARLDHAIWIDRRRCAEDSIGICR